jgi:hypothetical protein
LLGDRHGERVVDLAQPMLEDVRESDQHRQRDAAQHQRVDQLLQVDGSGGLFSGVDVYVAITLSGKVALPPTRDVIQLPGMLGGPPIRGVQDERSLSAISLQLAS